MFCVSIAIPRKKSAPRAESPGRPLYNLPNPGFPPGARVEVPVSTMEDEMAISAGAKAPGFELESTAGRLKLDGLGKRLVRSEEHTSELQSRENLVCRLLLEKKTRRGGPP